MSFEAEKTEPKGADVFFTPTGTIQDRIDAEEQAAATADAVVKMRAKLAHPAYGFTGAQRKAVEEFIASVV